MAATRPLVLVLRGPPLGRADALRPDRVHRRGRRRRSSCSEPRGRSCASSAPSFCTDGDRRTTIVPLGARRGGERGAARRAARRPRAPARQPRRGAAAQRGRQPAVPRGDRAHARRRGRARRRRATSTTLAVPTSLQAMIGSRLDGLPGAGQERRPPRVGRRDDVLVGRRRRAARRRRRRSIRASRRSSSATSSAATRTRAWPTSASGAFKHALIRDVAYARVPKGRRAHLHVRFADWMQGIPGAAEELVEILAYHLEQACRHAGVGRSDAPPPIERAVEALMRAAEKAERREGIREADRYYARALELLGDARDRAGARGAARPGGHAEQARRARARRTSSVRRRRRLARWRPGARICARGR